MRIGGVQAGGVEVTAAHFLHQRKDLARRKGRGADIFNADRAAVDRRFAFVGSPSPCKDLHLGSPVIMPLSSIHLEHVGGTGREEQTTREIHLAGGVIG